MSCLWMLYGVLNTEQGQINLGPYPAPHSLGPAVFKNMTHDVESVKNKP